MSSNTKHRQTISVAVTTQGARPANALIEALRIAGVDYSITDRGEVEEVPGLNRERLIELATWVAGEDAKRRLGLPSEWDQADWFLRDDSVGNVCGTTCCIAGKVAMEDGGVPVCQRFDDRTRRLVVVPWGEASPGMGGGHVLFPDSDEPVPTSEYAQKALGLDREQARRLFNGANNLNDILIVIGSLLRDGDSENADVPF